MDENKNNSVSDNGNDKDTEEVVFAANPKLSDESKNISSSVIHEENSVADSVQRRPVNAFVGSENKPKASSAESGSFIKSQVSSDTDDTSDEVVFAESKKSAFSPDNITEIKQKKKFPVIPVVLCSAGAVCLIAGAAFFVISLNNNNSIPVSTEVSVSSDSDTSSLESQVSVIEELEITEVDTTNILFGEGVTVEGVDLSGMSLSDAYYAMSDTLNEIRETINISIKCDGSTMSLTEDDFDFDTNISEVLIQAYHYSRGELETTTIETETGDDGVVDFKVTSVLNSDSIENAVQKVEDEFNVEPVDAHVVSFDPVAVEKFTYADGSNGYLLDEDELTEQITSILSQSVKTGSFSINTVETEFEITLDDIKANTKLISSHSTSAKNSSASNHNMKLAIETASGTIVEPGETFSFNEMTGDTTTGALGYVKSTAIVDGEYVDQYGGGICQASTTIYLAAVKADMEIVERYAHQYASSYASRGLDATVDYGNLDMKFKNTSDYAIYIATYVYDYNSDGYDELMVEFYGSPSTEYDEIVPVGWVTSVSSGSYTARGAKVYFKDGVEVKRENLPSGSYDFNGESSSYIYSLMPSDVSYGPTNVSPTYTTPTVYSPGGCGSSAPAAYGTNGTSTEESSEESDSSSSTEESSSTISITTNNAASTSTGAAAGGMTVLNGSTTASENSTVSSSATNSLNALNKKVNVADGLLNRKKFSGRTLT